MLSECRMSNQNRSNIVSNSSLFASNSVAIVLNEVHKVCLPTKSFVCLSRPSAPTYTLHIL